MASASFATASRHGSPSPEAALSKRFSWSRSHTDPFTPDAQVDDPLSSSLRPVPPRLETLQSFERSSMDSPPYQPGEIFEDVHLTAPDLERPPRSPGRSRYPTASSGTGATLRAMSKNLRRMSVRVVNFAGIGLDDQQQPVRLPDDEPELEKDEPIPDLASVTQVRGRTLGIFGPRSTLRNAMYNFLVWTWTEPMILLLIIADAVILTLQSWRALFLPDNGSADSVTGYFHTWEDYALFVLFVIFTLEAFARMIVTGLILDPETPLSSFFSHLGLAMRPVRPEIAAATTSASVPTLKDSMSAAPKNDVVSRLNRTWDTVRQPFELAHKREGTLPHHPTREASHAPSMSTSSNFSLPHIPSQISIPAPGSKKSELLSLPFVLSMSTQRGLSHRGVPYLRHSWNRIDAIAVVAFWASFALAMFGVERAQGVHISVFRALSVLRCARLLAITRGTTTIMHSLKIARPLLANVAYFVLFAMVLFSIIGVQSFRGSFRRSCVLVGATNITLKQMCGGFIDSTSLNVSGYIQLEGTPYPSPKGYICPLGQVCIEQDASPHFNVQSFDDIVLAALQVVIIASANTWSGVMYAAIDAEFFASAVFFIGCIIVLNFWLINLFVAVITNTFSAIRSQTKKSAFGAQANNPLLPDPNELGETWVPPPRGVSRAQKWYDRTRLVWVLLVCAGVAMQGTRTASSSQSWLQVLDRFELGLTLAFDLEILWRFGACLPDYRSFFLRHPGNNLDLFLAVGSSVIQIPFVKRSAVYPWLTIFQLGRFYRVILVVPRMRPLLLSVFGNLYGLANMSLFLIVTNFIAALFAVQIFRGDVADGQANMNFSQVFNAFLAMYQILSSENWTDVLYTATDAETPYRQAAIAALFLAGWFFFANFILVQLFIAVINENFEIAEEIKRTKQYDHFRRDARPEAERGVKWLDRWNPYRFFRSNPEAIVVDSLPGNLVHPLQRTIVLDSRTAQGAPGAVPRRTRGTLSRRNYTARGVNALQRLFIGDLGSDDVPMATFSARRRDSVAHDAGHAEEDDTERHLEILAAVNAENPRQEENANDVLFEQRAQRADFIYAHPSFDKSLWFFSQDNTLRQWCQRLVEPSNGERIFGKPPSPLLDVSFRLFLLLVVIGGIVVAAIATPIYRMEYRAQFGASRFAWFDIAESTFGLVLVVEFVIKVIADGFVFTPNAYLLNFWNIVDLFILCTMLVNVTTAILVIGGVSRLTRALKAFRALRLITLMRTMRETFQSLIFSGAARILDAALLALLYMIPYAIWGLNIFSGKLFGCNDNSNNIAGKSDCVNEFIITPLDGSSYGYLVPRVWDNPSTSTSWSFDDFRSSLLILFEIVSLEGWIDVMEASLAITGQDEQPQPNSSYVNAIFFLFYNLLGAIVILTLFVSIIIGNFSSRSGTALLTKEQREWIDLQKLISRQRPSKRPKVRPTSPMRAWCFDRAVNKHGFWSRAMTFLYIIHIAVLMTQTFSISSTGDLARDYFFLGVGAIYMLDVLVRLFGLGWKSYRANGWNVFDVVVVVGSIATTIPIILGSGGFITQQLQKLFLVSIAFKLVQKSNSLNQLFKTAVSSLPAIINLVMLWFSLFLFFGILYVEAFGLTRWESGESPNQNYSSFGRAIVMLAFMTTGEGWNQYMHNYATVYPRCTNSFPGQPVSDCGSVGWAFTLFIAWNVVSMYIFVNMFTGVVVENFSYVFQIAGTKSINREEMRAFKKVWAEFANARLGVLERNKLANFFGKLSGVFEVRIYKPEYRIQSIVAAARIPDDDPFAYAGPSGPTVIDGVDLNRLNKILAGIDYSHTKARRNLYCKLYHEASMAGKRGISFTNMLMMLAHYKLIDDDQALELKDLLARKETVARVLDIVRLDRVRSMLRMIYHRRKFLRWRDERDHPRHADQDIPHIVVDGLPSTPPLSSRDITLANADAYARLDDDVPVTPPPDSRYMSPDRGPSPPHSPRSPRGRRHVSDVSMLTTDFPSSFSASSRDDGVEEDAQAGAAAMSSSVWGAMFMRAAEEE